jgi:hypothetical protein
MSSKPYCIQQSRDTRCPALYPADTPQTDWLKGRVGLDLEPIPCHTGFVLFDQGFALLRWVISFREEHAVVSRCLLWFAYAAWLTEGIED